MKHISFSLSVLFIVVIIAMSSCKKEDVQELITSTASMSAKIDGTSWSAVTRVTKHFENSQKFVISGTSTNGEVLVITVFGDTQGTYSSSTSIDSLSAKVGCVWQPDASSPTTDNYVSQSGTVTFSSVNTSDKKVSGTFSFSLLDQSLSNSKSITEGKFTDLSYSEQ